METDPFTEKMFLKKCKTVGKYP